MSSIWNVDIANTVRAFSKMHNDDVYRSWYYLSNGSIANFGTLWPCPLLRSNILSIGHQPANWHQMSPADLRPLASPTVELLLLHLTLTAVTIIDTKRIIEAAMKELNDIIPATLSETSWIISMKRERMGSNCRDGDLKNTSEQASIQDYRFRLLNRARSAWCLCTKASPSRQTIYHEEGSSRGIPREQIKKIIFLN